MSEVHVTMPFKAHRSFVLWRTNTCQPSSQNGSGSLSDRLRTDKVSRKNSSVDPCSHSHGSKISHDSNGSGDRVRTC